MTSLHFSPKRNLPFRVQFRGHSPEEPATITNTTINKFITLASVLTIGATLPASAIQQDATAPDPYVAGLHQKCPTKNLHNLPDDDLNYQVKLFEIGLTQTQDQDFTKAARKACAKSTSGLACSNEAFLKVAERDHFLDHFVDYLCAQPTTCTAAGQCTPVK